MPVVLTIVMLANVFATAGAWQIAASHQQPSAGEKPFRIGQFATGGIRHVADIND